MNKDVQDNRLKINTSWIRTATKTEAPKVIVSNEFHLPVNDKTNNINKRRVIYGLLLFIIITVFAGIIIILTHQQPA